MSFARCTTKMFLGLLGAFFLASAIAAFVISGYVLVTYNHYDTFTSAQYALIPAVLFTFVGIIFLVTGFIGCWNMCHESKCLLFSFFLALLLILAMLVTSVSLSFAYKSQIDALIVNSSMDALYKYGDENRETAQVDFMQMQMQCCGFKNYTDWPLTPWSQRHPGSVPQSCCKRGAPACFGWMNETSTLNLDGCYPKWKALLLGNVKRIAVGSLVFTLILVYPPEELMLQCIML
ncbi:tetraspanin 3 [Trichuris trichiura]|uniref:Tetraspanin n=1 Tax=Trichuris trichiura TaxID=36087 RepID=A0A077Z5F0_TRITR|nr:tetraspanin 3 [Trichuris trichiura]